MERFTFKFFNKLLLTTVLGATSLHGQGGGQAVGTDSLAAPGRKLSYAALFRPHQFSFSADMVGYARMLFNHARDRQLHTLCLQLHSQRLFLNNEHHFSEVRIRHQNDSLSSLYTSTGYSSHLGPHLKLFTGQKRQRDVIFVGIQYARAWSQVHLSHTQALSFLGSHARMRSLSNVRARWWEATLGVQTRIVSQLYMGYSVRFMFYHRVRVSQNASFQPYHTPGYGMHNRTGKVRLLYSLRYVFDW